MHCGVGISMGSLDEVFARETFVIVYIGMTRSQLGLCMPTEQVSPVQVSSIYLTSLPPSVNISQQKTGLRGYP